MPDDELFTSGGKWRAIKRNPFYPYRSIVYSIRRSDSPSRKISQDNGLGFSRDCLESSLLPERKLESRGVYDEVLFFFDELNQAPTEVFWI